MKFDRVRTIISKEWAEVFKNRLVLFTVGFLPLLFTLLPLIILYFTGTAGDPGDVTDLPPQFLALCGDASALECVQSFIVSQFLLLFMIMPLVIPVNIAAYSIVGEKTTRSLEPLLATPITTLELLVGKGLAATIPAVAATWIGFGIFVAGVMLLSAGPLVVTSVLSPIWLAAILLAGPLMSVVAVTFAMIVSSRVSDPRAAEQLSVVVILPVLLVFFGQIAGLIVLNAQVLAIALALLLAADVALVLVAARVFQRETILTRWK
jgi:ABC-2 type transport system permease protein